MHTNTRHTTPLSSMLFQYQAVANWLTYYPSLVQPKTSLPCSQKPLLDQINSLLPLIYHLFKIRVILYAYLWEVVLHSQYNDWDTGSTTKACVRFLARAWLISPPKGPFRFWGHPAICSGMDNGAVSMRLKGCYWPPSIAKIKNDWNCTSTPALALRIAKREVLPGMN